VVDIDGTLWVQAGIFVLLVLVLKPLLFDPWLATQERRREALEGSFGQAESLNAEAKTLAQELELKLAAAREQAKEARLAARRQAEAAEAGRLMETREGVARELEEARARMAAEDQEARAVLHARVDQLASLVCEKVLGRKV
jgi:F-type H+-transporting ATPase subunit b